MSFAQANKQKKLQKQAQADAEKAMDSARAMIDQAEKRLDINYYDKLAVNKEPYERAREQFTSTAAQAMEAGVESERGAAATAGRVLMSQNLAQGDVRSEMSKEIQNIEMLKADEEARLRDMKTRLDMERANIDKGEAEGAQLAARDAQQAAAAATQQGFQSLTSMGQQAIQMAPLYGQDLGAQKSAVYTAVGKDDPAMINLRTQDYNGQQIGLIDFNKMSDSDFRQFKRSLSPEQRQALFTNENYLNNYNPFQPY
jgi:hypothetical protein